MKEIFINKDNLKDSEIDEEVVRVKAFMINSKNEILLGYSYNCYQFPGGHKEKGETVKEVLKREIKEETGIDIKFDINDPFLLLKYYKKNYLNKNKNRCNKIYYILINIDQTPCIENTCYTKQELRGNFKLKYIKLDNFKTEIMINTLFNPDSKIITSEMIEAYDYFEKEVYA